MAKEFVRFGDVHFLAASGEVDDSEVVQSVAGLLLGSEPRADSTRSRAPSPFVVCGYVMLRFPEYNLAPFSSIMPAPTLPSLRGGRVSYLHMITHLSRSSVLEKSGILQ